MKVDVYARFGDFCGNNDYYYYGQFYCDSIEEARKIFPKGGVAGWKVEVATRIVEPLPLTPVTLPKESDFINGRIKK